MNLWSKLLQDYYLSLKPPAHLPDSIQWLYPQQQKEVQYILHRFFKKYYHDDLARVLCLGINPGRFGAGVTGINFTAPRQLARECGIEHGLKDQSEVSAEFIYEMIGQYGGPEQFYRHFFIGAVCPLGLVQDGKNLNYYDDKKLLKELTPFIVQNIEQLVSFPFSRKHCICIGGEKNFRFLSSLNNEYRWFEKIHPLPHPRFVMQYRRKHLQQFVDQYLNVLQHVRATE